MNHLPIHKRRGYSYLRAYKAPLQLSRILYKSTLFLQNKPNFQIAQMNVSSFLTKNYENTSDSTLGENKPNTNPKQTQTNPISQSLKMNVTVCPTGNYQNQPLRRLPENKPNQTQSRKCQKERDGEKLNSPDSLELSLNLKSCCGLPQGENKYISLLKLDTLRSCRREIHCNSIF